MNKFSDLRLVIGLFFLIIGMILSGYYFIAEKNMIINIQCGIVFSVFGLLMIALSTFRKSDD